MIILNEWYECNHMARPFWSQSGAEIILLLEVGPFWGRAILGFVLIYTDINKYVPRGAVLYSPNYNSSQYKYIVQYRHKPIQTQAIVRMSDTFAFNFCLA